MAEKRKIQIFRPLTHILVTITEQRKATEISAYMQTERKSYVIKGLFGIRLPPPVGVSLSFCTPLYSRRVWCRPRPQGEPWVDVHSFLLDLKRSLRFFLSLFFSFRDEREAFRDQNCVYQKVEVRWLFWKVTFDANFLMFGLLKGKAWKWWKIRDKSWFKTQF